MFEKLLSNLPFNPALIHQVAFYGRRMRQEASIRRIGLAFIVLAFFIQFIAVLSPPQPTMAQSNNDLINGGFSSQSAAVSSCESNVGNYADILQYYGISCRDVANATTTTLTSTAYNKDLYSMGRLPYGKSGETPVSIGGKTYYFRYLWSWDTHGSSSYKTLKGTSSITGKTFYILYACGNLVFVGLPIPAQRCQWNNDIFANDARCVSPRCALDTSLSADSPLCKSCPYDSKILKSDARCVACPYPGHGNVLKSSPQCKPPCPYDSSIANDSPQCKPCGTAQTRDDKTACLVLSKSVANDTAGLADANNTTAQPGDTLTYTLNAKNDGRAAIQRYVIQEDISDVLDYAIVTDYHGGSEDPETHVVTWPAQTIAADATLSQRLTVQVKTQLPDTPTSTSDPGHYDLTMTNVYGNAVNVHLPASTIKTTEQVVANLPNTGPGTSLLVSFAITVIAGYFLMRSRLLAKETAVVLSTHTQGGL